MARKPAKKKQDKPKGGGKVVKLTPDDINKAVRLGRVKLKNALDGVSTDGLDADEKKAYDEAALGENEPDFGKLFGGFDKHLDLKQVRNFKAWGLAALCWMKRNGKGQITCTPKDSGCEVRINLPNVTNVDTLPRIGKKKTCEDIGPILKAITQRLAACTIFKGAPTIETLLTDLHGHLKP